MLVNLWCHRLSRLLKTCFIFGVRLLVILISRSFVYLYYLLIFKATYFLIWNWIKNQENGREFIFPIKEMEKKDIYSRISCVQFYFWRLINTHKRGEHITWQKGTFRHLVSRHGSLQLNSTVSANMWGGSNMTCFSVLTTDARPVFWFFYFTVRDDPAR